MIIEEFCLILKIWASNLWLGKGLPRRFKPQNFATIFSNCTIRAEFARSSHIQNGHFCPQCLILKKTILGFNHVRRKNINFGLWLRCRVSQEGSIPQISRPYLAIVWSELHFTVADTFKMAILPTMVDPEKNNHFEF